MLTPHFAYHDVSPAGSMPFERTRESLGRALRWGGMSAPADSSRYDASGLVGVDGTLDGWHRHVDELSIAELGPNRQDAARRILANYRMDALPGGAGGFPRDFEFIRSQIWEEKRQPLSAMMLFPIDGSVPLGARRHTARRALGSGEAQIHRGGSEFPRARTTYVEESFGVAYVVCSVDVNFFDALTTDWAGLQQYQRDLRLAYRLVEERLNRIAWFGDSGAGLAGVLNYPHLAKMVFPVSITDTPAPEDIAAALNDFSNKPIITSAGIFSPTELAVSPRIHAFLFSRKHSTQGGTDTSIGEYFLKGQAAGGAGIRAIRMVPELAGIGPSGEDGMLAYRPDLDSVGHVLIQGPTPLPVYQSSPLDQTTVVFAATGGVIMGDVGNAILAYADVT